MTLLWTTININCYRNGHGTYPWTMSSSGSSSSRVQVPVPPAVECHKAFRKPQRLEDGFKVGNFMEFIGDASMKNMLLFHGIYW